MKWKQTQNRKIDVYLTNEIFPLKLEWMFL